MASTTAFGAHSPDGYRSSDNENKTRISADSTENVDSIEMARDGAGSDDEDEDSDFDSDFDSESSDSEDEEEEEEAYNKLMQEIPIGSFVYVVPREHVVTPVAAPLPVPPQYHPHQNFDGQDYHIHNHQNAQGLLMAPAAGAVATYTETQVLIRCHLCHSLMGHGVVLTGTTTYTTQRQYQNLDYHYAPG